MQFNDTDDDRLTTKQMRRLDTLALGTVLAVVTGLFLGLYFLVGFEITVVALLSTLLVTVNQ